MAFDSHKAVRVSEVRIVIRLYHFSFFPTKLQISSAWTSFTGTLTIFFASSRSHFSPAVTRSFRMVVWWTPVSRCAVFTEHPSSSNSSAWIPLATGRCMEPSGFSGRKENVLPQPLQQ